MSEPMIVFHLRIPVELDEALRQRAEQLNLKVADVARIGLAKEAQLGQSIPAPVRERVEMKMIKIKLDDVIQVRVTSAQKIALYQEAERRCIRPADVVRWALSRVIVEKRREEHHDPSTDPRTKV